MGELTSPNSYTSLVLTVLANSKPSMLGTFANCAFNASISKLSEEMIQFMAPLVLTCATNTLVSSPSIDTILFSIK